MQVFHLKIKDKKTVQKGSSVTVESTKIKKYFTAAVVGGYDLPGEPSEEACSDTKERKR